MAFVATVQKIITYALGSWVNWLLHPCSFATSFKERTKRRACEGWSDQCCWMVDINMAEWIDRFPTNIAWHSGLQRMSKGNQIWAPVDSRPPRSALQTPRRRASHQFEVLFVQVLCISINLQKISFTGQGPLDPWNLGKDWGLKNEGCGWDQGMGKNLWGNTLKS